MIKIRRPAQVPAILVGDGALRHAEHGAAIASNEPFEFDKSIYGSKDVKKALERAQHGKCCFCESKVLHVSPGDVEHFRPKAAVRIAGRATLS